MEKGDDRMEHAVQQKEDRRLLMRREASEVLDVEYQRGCQALVPCCHFVLQLSIQRTVVSLVRLGNYLLAWTDVSSISSVRSVFLLTWLFSTSPMRPRSWTRRAKWPKTKLGGGGLEKSCPSAVVSGSAVSN